MEIFGAVEETNMQINTGAVSSYQYCSAELKHTEDSCAFA